MSILWCSSQNLRMYHTFGSHTGCAVGDITHFALCFTMILSHSFENWRQLHTLSTHRFGTTVRYVNFAMLISQSANVSSIRPHGGSRTLFFRMKIIHSGPGGSRRPQGGSREAPGKHFLKENRPFWARWRQEAPGRLQESIFKRKIDHSGPGGARDSREAPG